MDEYDGLTALMSAVLLDDEAMVRILLECDPDPFILNRDGRNVLFIAAERGLNSILHLLFDFYSPISTQEPNMNRASVRSRKYRMTVHSMVCGAYSQEIPSVPYTTALHVSAIFDRAHTVRYLLQRGADCTKRDEEGHTPLESAKAATATAAERVLHLTTIPINGRLKYNIVRDKLQPRL